MDDWKDFFQEGKQFLNATTGKNGRPSKLANDIRYNLLALSVEKSIMALLRFNNDMADNHTFSDLLHSVSGYVLIPGTIKDELLELEKTQTICNVWEYHRAIPTDQEVTRLTIVAEYLLELANRTCSDAAVDMTAGN